MEEIEVKEETTAAVAPRASYAKRIQKKKVCQFCVDKVAEVDYKDVNRLRRFVTEKGKIIPRRMSGVCARHQRALSVAIKKARVMALLPYSAK